MGNGDRREKDRQEESLQGEDRLEGEESWLEGDEDSHLYDDWDDLASDPEEASRLSRAIEGILPDIVRRSVGGLVSEDGIRTLVKDRGLPREAVGFMLGQVDATKREVVRMVSKEVRMFLENVDLGGELTKILTSISFEIRTEVRFIPNDAAVKPNVRNRVRVRAQNQAQAEPEEEPEGPGPDELDSDGSNGVEEASDTDEQSSRRRRWSFRGRGKSADDGGEGVEDDEQ